MVTYKTSRVFSVLSTTGSTRKLATVTAWNGGKPKLDIRTWRTDGNGQEVPVKGVTLDRAELTALLQALEDQGIPGEI